MIFYRLSKIAGRYERDPTQEEFKKSFNDALAFVVDDCVGSALDVFLKVKREENKDKKGKFLEYISQYTHTMEVILILG